MRKRRKRLTRAEKIAMGKKYPGPKPNRHSETRPSDFCGLNMGCADPDICNALGFGCAPRALMSNNNQALLRSDGRAIPVDQLFRGSVRISRKAKLKFTINSPDYE